MDYAANIKAINDYFNRTPRLTTKATEVYDQWRIFHEKLSSAWWLTQEDYDKARNFRNEFNRANAVTAEQKEIVETVIRSGMTSEQVEATWWEAMTNNQATGVGDSGRRTTSTGDYLPPETIAGEDFFPLRVKIFAAIAGILGLIAYLGPKHPIFTPLKVSKKFLLNNKK